MKIADTPEDSPVFSFPRQLFKDQSLDLSSCVDALIDVVGICGSAGNEWGQRYNIQLFLGGPKSLKIT